MNSRKFHQLVSTLDPGQIKENEVNLSGKFKLSVEEEIRNLRKWLVDLNKGQDSTLSILRLDNCNIGGQESIYQTLLDEDVRLFAASLRNSAQTIDKKVEQFQCLLQEHPNLLQLTISNNNFYEKEMELVIFALSNHKKLRVLDLSCNKLGHKNLVSLTKRLTLSDYDLKYFNLSRCNIDDTGISILAEGLKVNTHLRELNLSKNLITNKGIKLLDSVLDVNKVLVKIELNENDNLDPDLLKQLQVKLQQNKLQRDRLHENLVNPQTMLKKACTAIDIDDVSSLEILFCPNIGKEKRRFSKRLARINLKLEQKRQICTYSQAQIDFLEEISPADLQNSARLKSCQDRNKAFLIDLYHKKEANNSNEKEDVLDFDLSLDATSSLEELIEDCKKRLSKAQKEAEKLESTQKRLQTEWQSLQEEYQRLQFQAGQLVFDEFAIASEQEEIVPKILDNSLNPNQMDENGQTLLHRAFAQENINSLAFLLKKGASPFIPNKEGDSVFYLILKAKKDVANRCHKIVVEYIKKNINIAFSSLYEDHLQDYAARLQKIKANILDPYLDNLIEKNNRMPSFMLQLLLFFQGDLEREKDLNEYYRQLIQVNADNSVNPLVNILNELLAIAKKGKYGPLNQSKLHDSIKLHVRSFFNSAKMRYEDYEKRLEAARAEIRAEQNEEQFNKWKEGLEKEAEERERKLKEQLDKQAEQLRKEAEERTKLEEKLRKEAEEAKEQLRKEAEERAKLEEKLRKEADERINQMMQFFMQKLNEQNKSNEKSSTDHFIADIPKGTEEPSTQKVSGSNKLSLFAHAGENGTKEQIQPITKPFQSHPV